MRAVVEQARSNCLTRWNYLDLEVIFGLHWFAADGLFGAQRKVFEEGDLPQLLAQAQLGIGQKLFGNRHKKKAGQNSAKTSGSPQVKNRISLRKEPAARFTSISPVWLRLDRVPNAVCA